MTISNQNARRFDLTRASDGRGDFLRELATPNLKSSSNRMAQPKKDRPGTADWLASLISAVLSVGNGYPRQGSRAGRH